MIKTRHPRFFPSPIPQRLQGTLRLRLGNPWLLACLLSCFAVSYYLAVRLGLEFRFYNSQIGVVWPANGLFLSALVLTPKKLWWMVLLAAALAHTAAIGLTIPAWRLLWQIAGNSVFVISTVEILRRFAGLPLHLGARRQVLAYTAVAFLMPGLFGFTTPAFIRSLFHLESIYSPAAALLRTTLSNSTALLLVAPVIFLWADYGLKGLSTLSARRICEAMVILTSLVIVGLFALGSGPEIARFRGLLLWVFAPLLWAAVRFGPLGASTSLFLVAALSMWGTEQRLGPFVLRTNADLVLSLQLFWIALWLPVTLLAAVIRERELTERALQDQRNQLAHVTRVATAGELSVAIAHELRQPLGSILLNAETATHLLDPPNLPALRAILDDIISQDKQAAGIITRLRSFLQKDKSNFEILALETVVRDALTLGHSVIATSAIEVQTQIADGLPRVRGDQVQLLQIILNLIVNACDSMSATPVSDRHLRIQVARTSGQQVEVLIADRGVGLPEGGEDRVFEPFFTTKEKGLGLGLPICRSIATAHDGRLWAENNPQGGATFHLVLPISSRAIDPARA